jgi:hypothetical protein
MLRLGLIAAVLLIPLSAAALTQWPRECRRDVVKVCRDVQREPDRTVLTCLQTNEKTLSKGCRKLLQSYGHLPK